MNLFDWRVTYVEGYNRKTVVITGQDTLLHALYVFQDRMSASGRMVRILKVGIVCHEKK